MACDICGKTGTTLADLREPYQSKDIKQCCDDCERDLNRQLGKLRMVTHNILVDWFKRYISNKRTAATQPAASEGQG